MKYLMLVCADPNLKVRAEDMVPVEPWVEEMDGRGIRLEGDRLAPASAGALVRTRDGAVVTTDAPFAGAAATKEQIAGYDIVECANLDEAIEVAAKHPVARFGVLELRPFWED